MRVIEAPNYVDINDGEIAVFLAGGITNCPDWQAEVIEKLKEYPNTDNLVIYNPRRSNFDINDPEAADKQIAWEYEYLNKMDIFSMYFCSGVSDQPICMYELGRHLERMQVKFKYGYKRIVVSVEEGYKRAKDVLVQTKLATKEDIVQYGEKVTPASHAYEIYKAYIALNLKVNASVNINLYDIDGTKKGFMYGLKDVKFVNMDNFVNETKDDPCFRYLYIMDKYLDNGEVIELHNLYYKVNLPVPMNTGILFTEFRDMFE